MGGYKGIGRYGRTNGRTFDLPRSILGGRISELLGYRSGANPSRPHHSPSETPENRVFGQLFCHNSYHKGITNASLARLEVFVSRKALGS